MKDIERDVMHRSTFMMVIFSVTWVLFLGCAGLRLQAPSVTVVSMNVVEASLFEQRFTFKLRVQNPNDMDIPVTGMSFEIKLNDQPFAKGVSNKPVNLPRLGEAIVEVTAVSDLSGILRQLKELSKEKRSSLSYLIKGRLVTGSLPALNFENSGLLEMPMP